jgi:hypothetical protein
MTPASAFLAQLKEMTRPEVIVMRETRKWPVIPTDSVIG